MKEFMMNIAKTKTANLFTKNKLVSKLKGEN